MAGQGRTIPRNGARHTAAAVVLCCLTTIVFSAAAAWADCLITLSDGKTVGTSGCWIQGDTLSSAEDREPSGDYEGRSDREGDLSEDQTKGREESMQEVRRLVSGLLAREGALLKEQMDLLEEITERETTAGTVIEPEERESFLPGLESRAQAVEDLKEAWSGLTLPDRSLLLARDIKMLQLMSLDASVEHAMKYAESGDPTNREYAWEHARQAVAFQESFREALPWD